MNILVFAACLITLCTGEEIPTNPGDNSHYVEGKSRYVWMPDGAGVPILVDLQVPVNKTIINAARNGANNQYWLYTRRNPNSHQLLVQWNANSVLGSNYNGNRPTNVIVHSWQEDGTSELNPLITNAFLASQDCNVIVVDWRRAAVNNYPTSVAAVPSVGEFLGNFLIWLNSITGTSWNNFHLVGFGLGAHVVGNAGRAANGRPMRVTGLDPAGPLWIGNSEALNILSGLYVEVIHTDGFGFGIYIRSGHADFYPNGGRHPQPGCLTNICSHRRAYELFATSVRFNNLIGCECIMPNQAEARRCSSNTLHMGNSILSKRGSGSFCFTGRPYIPLLKLIRN